ncbi:MAG: 50S ribosomal protein L11 [Promethearchaeia archaeon]
MSEANKITVDAMVEGGKASGGPPIGPALGPTGVNIYQVVQEINEVTEPYKGLKVPVTIIVDPSSKEFEVEVGTPPTSALILKQVGAPQGSGEPNLTKVGDISLEELKEVAKGKAKDLTALDMKSAVLTVAGTCVSMGVTIEGKDPKVFQEEVASGEWDEQLDEPFREE